MSGVKGMPPAGARRAGASPAGPAAGASAAPSPAASAPRTYAFPPGGMPDAGADPDADGAVFTPAYALLPAATMRDIVTSRLPGWRDTRAWILARPLTGFAETFAQYAVEVAPGGGTGGGTDGSGSEDGSGGNEGGGSDAPEPDPGAEAALFVAEGEMTLGLEGREARLVAGGFAYVPPGVKWRVANAAAGPLRFHWIRKRWQPAPGLAPPPFFTASDADIPPEPMPGTGGAWATTRFMDPDDLRHDMHITIVTLRPGARIPFAETHVMEHGLYVLQGRGRYLLNREWHEVGPGDFMWLRAFCPQACIATGEEPFRYLLYKDVNRHPDLVLP